MVLVAVIVLNITLFFFYLSDTKIPFLFKIEKSNNEIVVAIRMSF